MTSKSLTLVATLALALAGQGAWTLEWTDTKKTQGTITSGDVVLNVEVFSAAERKLTVSAKTAWTAPTLDLRGDVSDGEEAWTIVMIKGWTSAQWKGIQTLCLPETMEIIGPYAFADITTLTKIDPMFPAAVTNIGAGAFRKGQIAGDLVISNPNFVEIGPQTFSANESVGRLTSVDLSGTSIARIGDSAFFKQDVLTSVKLPAESTLETIGNQGLRCKNLASLTPEEQPALKSIGEAAFSQDTVLATGLIATNCESLGKSAFYQCSALPSFVGPRVVNLGNQTFQQCTALTNVELNAAAKIPNSCFYNCPGLVRLTPTCFTESQIEKGTFFNTSSLAVGLEFPSATNIPAAFHTGDDNTFQGSGISYIKAPNVRNVAKSAFYNCKKLGDVYLPSCTNLLDTVFQNCSALTNVVFSPDIAHIGMNVFWSDSNLTTFSPTTFKKLVDTGSGVFSSCTKLTGCFVFDSPAYRNMKTLTFNQCNSVTGIVFKASAVTNISGQALANLAPGACVYFYHDCPTFTDARVHSQKVSPPNRMRIYANGAKTSPAWAAAMEDNPTYFNSQKTAVDYPGEKTVGFIYKGDDRAWVIDWRPPSAFMVIVR